MSHHAVCKCFGLAVGEDVYDLRLPSVSRIPGIHVTVWISCWTVHLWFSIIAFVYISFSLCLLYYGFPRRCSALPSTIPVLLLDVFQYVVFCLYSPGRPQFRSPGICRGCLFATPSPGEAAFPHKSPIIIRIVQLLFL